MSAEIIDSNVIPDPEKWVGLYGDYLYSYAFMRLSDSNLAEDVVQETFLAALKARTNFARQSTVKTWLTGILKRKIIDHFRKSGREESLDHDQLSRLKDDDDFITNGLKSGNWKTGRRPQDWMLDQSDRAETKEFWEFLKFCIAALPRKLAELFILREMEELNATEISNVLDISATNLRVMLFRTRKKLRACLEDNWIGDKKS